MTIRIDAGATAESILLLLGKVDDPDTLTQDIKRIYLQHYPIAYNDLVHFFGQFKRTFGIIVYFLSECERKNKPVEKAEELAKAFAYLLAAVNYIASAEVLISEKEARNSIPQSEIKEALLLLDDIGKKIINLKKSLGAAWSVSNPILIRIETLYHDRKSSLPKIKIDFLASVEAMLKSV